MNFSLDKWTSGEMSISLPEPNIFWRILGWTERIYTIRVVSTDYRNFEISYRCNTDHWLYSTDEYVLAVRNLANGQNVLNSLLKDEILKNEALKEFTHVNHSNQNCKNITFTILTKPFRV